MFIHCVYFWLREDLSADDEKRFRDGLASLVSIASVDHGHYGTPADTDREIIDRSYSYGLVVAFADQAAHDAYQEDSIHDAFRDNCAQYWTKVKIYDFETV